MQHVHFVDPDAPSRKEPTYREWHHWLVVNIPGDDVSKGDVLSEYVGSGPPPNTGFLYHHRNRNYLFVGLHRYVFLVYKQSARITDTDHGKLTNRSADKRGGWSAHKFADKHKLGKPIAGNFYEVTSFVLMIRFHLTVSDIFRRNMTTMYRYFTNNSARNRDEHLSSIHRHFVG